MPRPSSFRSPPGLISGPGKPAIGLQTLIDKLEWLGKHKIHADSSDEAIAEAFRLGQDDKLSPLKAKASTYEQSFNLKAFDIALSSSSWDACATLSTARAKAMTPLQRGTLTHCLDLAVHLCVRDVEDPTIDAVFESVKARLSSWGLGHFVPEAHAAVESFFNNTPGASDTNKPGG